MVVILDKNKQKMAEMSHIDLGAYEVDGTPTVWIARELEQGAYGIHPHEYFL